MDKRDRIYVAGSETVVGKALLRKLAAGGYFNVIDTSSEEPDLTDRAKVDAYFEAMRPDYVFLAAGKSGGIGANQKYPADLMLNNLLIQCQVIRSAQRHGARKLLYVASSCSYPRSCPQPMQVRFLMTGPLESTSEAYAMAKIAGIKLCQAYQQQHGADMISVIPGDVFGPGDDFSLEDSHVIAALIRKMHQAKIDGAPTVEVWGSGSPRREFIFVDDVADAAIFLMQSYSDSIAVNVGSGSEISIRNIAELIRRVVGYNGQLRFDSTKPDGMPLKALDSSALMAMGWRPKVSLQRGLEETYRWFLETTKEDV
ncbi:MAG TPA: GDP-L-fucose synthase [Candidatus Binatia bacterium]|nr:GDP-L-fucose synthase [Candidatus Binatia bacterium]